jgi:hypothetical protein
VASSRTAKTGSAETYPCISLIRMSSPVPSLPFQHTPTCQHATTASLRAPLSFYPPLTAAAGAGVPLPEVSEGDSVLACVTIARAPWPHFPRPLHLQMKWGLHRDAGAKKNYGAVRRVRVDDDKGKKC